MQLDFILFKMMTYPKLSRPTPENPMVDWKMKWQTATAAFVDILKRKIGEGRSGIQSKLRGNT